MRLSLVVLGLAGWLGAVSASAHEFWISPEAYQVPEGGTITAHIRVGQNFAGSAYSYIDMNIARFDLVQGESVVPVTGRMGDRPALNMAAPGPGLWVAVHQTSDSFLRYDKREMFVDFVTHKDFAWVLEEHAARGLPETGFRERYSRYAKALLAVGDGAGADREVGLLTEIVALANPYTDDLSGGLPVRVLYEGAPRANVQVEVFARDAAGEVTVTTTRTDTDGQAVIAVAPGTEYLVDAVVMRPLEPEAEDDPVWESLWAALTFAVPAE
jgi:uncharacterized GH25 family protein